jgi:hypothetical protein
MIPLFSQVFIIKGSFTLAVIYSVSVGKNAIDSCKDELDLTHLLIWQQTGRFQREKNLKRELLQRISIWNNQISLSEFPLRLKPYLHEGPISH